MQSETSARRFSLRTSAFSSGMKKNMPIYAVKYQYCFEVTGRNASAKFETPTEPTPAMQ